MNNKTEKKLQDSFSWARSQHYHNYNSVLGYYHVQSILENARGDSLLDLPCGDGTLTEMMKPHFNRVVGVDASGIHLKVAKERLPNVEFYESLLEEFNYPEKFDTIVMINVLEHVIDPDVALRKGASLMSEEGILIVHVPNAHAINRRLAVLMGSITHCEELSPFDIEIAGHRRSYSLPSLIHDMERAGLKIVATGGIFYKMLSTPQMDWFLKNGLWEEGGFGWGRVGGPKKDWKAEFCRACYELGKKQPEDCNIIYACAIKR